MSRFILIGIISMSVIQVCQIDVAYVLLYDLWSKSLKHTFIAPVRSFQLILGSWMIGIVRSLFVFLLLSVSSHLPLVSIFSDPGSGPYLFLLGLFVISLVVGIAVCILVLLFGYKADVAAWSFSYLMSLLCGIYYPISILPLTSPRDRTGHSLDLLFWSTSGRSMGFREKQRLLGWGFGLTGLYLVLEAFLFRAVLRRARRVGTLIKLSE